MRKTLVLALLVASAWAQTTTTITGTLKDLTGALVTSGKVVFTLTPSRDTTISGIARFTPSQVVCLINSSGQIKAQDGTSTCTLTMNTALQPTGSFYAVAVWPYNVKTSTFSFYAVNSSYDWSTVVPTPTTSPAQNFVDTFSTQTVGGSKTFSSLAYFPGGISDTGPFSISGPISAPSCTFFLGVACIDPSNSAGWSGSDPGAWLNAAYASQPSRGGRIVVVNGSYPNVTTPIVFGVASKPVAINCDPETTLTWGSTSGTMFTFNYGNAGNLHDRNAGIFGCTLVGQSTGTATAISIGGTNGAEGFKLVNAHISFTAGTAITWGNNTWATLIDGSSIIAQVAYNFGSGLTGSGEDVEIRNSVAQGVPSGYVNCATMGNSGLALNIFGGSFDDCQLVLSSGYVSMTGTHFEDPGVRSDALGNPTLVLSGINGAITGIEVLQDSASPTKANEISVTGGNVSFFGLGASSNGTIANLFSLSNSAVVGFFHGPATFGNFTALVTAAGSSQLTDFVSSGASGPVVTVYNSSGNGGVFEHQGQLKIDVTTGTAPLSIASSTPVNTLVVSNHPKVINCGSAAACSVTQETGGFVIHGVVPLVAGTATVTGLNFSAANWHCTTNDTTNVANGSKMISASNTTATVTGTGTDNIAYICAGK